MADVRFPDGFLIGASTSPHQVEGGNVHSDWWALEQAPDSPIAEPSGDACDSYHRWRDDMQLLADAGLTAYRFGVEWARIEPADGQFDQTEIAHYREMVEHAVRLGIEPLLTLHHFTSPAWFTLSGGWSRPDAVERFRRYVEAIAPVIEAGARRVITINEPNMLAIMMRVIRGEVSLDTGLGGALPEPDAAVRDVLAAAHRAVRDDLHARHPGVKVGWSVANQCVQAAPGGQDRADAYREAVEDAFLRVGADDDFIGVQAYTRTVFGPDGVVPAEGARTLTGWEVYPDAVGEAARHTFEVIGGVPILVTENGIATSDDTQRIAYLEGALDALSRAMGDGIRVDGYLHWSLLDNYEWGSWAPTFGLIAVDRASGSFDRTPKPSLAWLGEVARRTLTTEQKAALTSGADTWTTAAVPGIPSITMSDGPHGLRRQAQGGDAFGINASVPATCFPPAAGLASSWNDELIREVGAHLGREARALGVHMLLGPGLNIKRSPLCGRNFEYASEDPLVSGRFAAALVEGVQSQGVAATPKHFAVNNQETDRFRVSAEVDERALREIYLPAFERVVREARPWALMSAYNRVNGVFASQNRWLLTDLLRGEWGFDGIVVSDWGAVNDRVAALNAGLDLEMPPSGTDDEIVDAVARGAVTSDVLDRTVRRHALLRERVGAAATSSDPARADATPSAGAPSSPVADSAAAPAETHPLRDGITGDLAATGDALAIEAARESIVLLSNDGTLPLAAETLTRVAVIGPFARDPRYQGGGSSHVNPTTLHRPLDELVDRLGADRVTAADGFRLDGHDDAQLLAEAAAAASSADVAVVFVGLPDGEESEGSDRTSLQLPAVQRDLLEKLVAGDTPVVVVLSAGAVVELGPWRERAAAVLNGWLLGQGGGRAIADLLLGDVSPSGRLTETIPLSLDDTPSRLTFPGRDGVAVYGESIYVGYRHFDTRSIPVAYPFGHGLTYSTFAYDHLALSESAPNTYRVTATITNTGARRAAEVAQLYVRSDAGSRPLRELRGYTRVDLEPGESRMIEFALEPRDFSLWNVREHRWQVDAGEYTVELGASSRDIRLSTVVRSAGDGHVPELTGESTIGEWLDHPVGSAVIAPLVDGVSSRTGGEAAPEHVAMFRQMPLGKLTAWGVGFDQATLDGMVAAVRAGLRTE